MVRILALLPIWNHNNYYDKRSKEIRIGRCQARKTKSIESKLFCSSNL